MVKIGLIGCGYWGKHYLRLLSKLPCQLIGICDINPEKKKLAAEYRIAYFSDYRKLLKKVEAVAIVTPPASHYKLARKALLYGKHVLLEKPYVFKSKQAEELRALALKSDLVLSPALVYLYNPAIAKLKELIDKNLLGRLYYLTLDWLNLGIIRPDVNALWNFAPHPFSVLRYLLGELPRSVQVTGRAYIQKNIEDFVLCNLFYPDGLMAHIKLSWLHPLKVRRVTVVGSKRLVQFDDTRTDSPIEIYDKGISPEEFRQAQNWESFSEFKAKTRYGDVGQPILGKAEPLKEELKNFISAVVGKEKIIADAGLGVDIVRLLESAQKSLSKEGKIISVR